MWTWINHIRKKKSHLKKKLNVTKFTCKNTNEPKKLFIFPTLVNLFSHFHVISFHLFDSSKFFIFFKFFISNQSNFDVSQTNNCFNLFFFCFFLHTREYEHEHEKSNCVKKRHENNITWGTHEKITWKINIVFKQIWE